MEYFVSIYSFNESCNVLENLRGDMNSLIKRTFNTLLWYRPHLLQMHEESDLAHYTNDYFLFK